MSELVEKDEEEENEEDAEGDSVAMAVIAILASRSALRCALSRFAFSRARLCRQ